MIFEKVTALMPCRIRDEILEYLRLARVSERSVNEIRLRLYGTLSLVVSGRNVALGSRVSKEELREIFKRVCGGAVYAHRDDMCRGFVTLDGGVRVGVCAEARYERDSVVGVGEISSLVFRIPSSECSFADGLYSSWLSSGSGGMLICSAAGEGKTSAIRSLARLIGGGKHPYRVVVVDERCEFDTGKYSGTHVDILRGYRRPLGVDIAIRTLSAEVVIVDEVSSREDASAILSALGAGVRVIATAHAKSFSDVARRPYIKELIDAGSFDTVCVISRKNGRFGFALEPVDAPLCKS
jgi:stage III sporulation protein AA